MIKFSVIVPIYNVEKYLRKCLLSIQKQTYNNFEVILVNDGSTDSSQIIIDEFVKKDKRFRGYKKKNGGLSDARNYGLKKISGDYFIFVDSDDYINDDLLNVLNEYIRENHCEMLGYNLVLTDEKDNSIGCLKKPIINVCSGEDAILTLIKTKNIFETACAYAYKYDFWKKNNFKFLEKVYHEDFELIPRIILKSKKFACIDFDGYYYFQSTNSITRNSQYTKTLKKAYDTLMHFDKLLLEKEKIQNKETKKYFLSYIANAVIAKKDNLDKVDKKNYTKELLKRNVGKYLNDDTFLKSIKKIKIIIELIIKSHI